MTWTNRLRLVGGLLDTVAGDNEYGNRIEGRDAIARAFEGVWTTMPDVQWADHEHFLSEDGTRGVSQWTFRATNPDGTRTEVQGVDLFRIRDGRIVEKQAIRKQRPPVAVASSAPAGASRR